MGISESSEMGAETSDADRYIWREEIRRGIRD